MWDWKLFNLGISQNGYILTFWDSVLVMVSALVLSLAVALTYIFTHKKSGYSQSLIITIFLLGPAVALIVLCVGSNMARAISIGGGLALIRFRNTVDDTKDMIYLLLALSSGVACGIGFIGFAALAIAILCVVLIICTLVGFDRVGGKNMMLRILIPESLDFHGVFDPVLKEYCKSFNLDKVKVTDYGTVLELDYRIRMKDLSKQKKLIDEIRTRNGNLNISLVQSVNN